MAYCSTDTRAVCCAYGIAQCSAVCCADHRSYGSTQCSTFCGSDACALALAHSVALACSDALTHGSAYCDADSCTSLCSWHAPVRSEVGRVRESWRQQQLSIQGGRVRSRLPLRVRLWSCAS